MVPLLFGLSKKFWLPILGLTLLIVVAVFGQAWWRPASHKEPGSKSLRLASLSKPLPKGHSHDDGHDHGDHSPDHGDHDHDHPGHNEDTALELSEQARKNIGLQLEKVRLQPFVRTVTLQGIVVERPGRSQIAIPAPLTGIITSIYPIAGEAIEPGQKLFTMRMTHEELVSGQGEFLATAEQLDVVRHDMRRLQEVSQGGVIAGKSLLTRQYEVQKLEAAQRAQRQGLLLHGLTEAQIDDILATRNLLREMTISAPPRTDDGPDLYHIQQLAVQPGQHVQQGETLCVLADHAQLFVEGKAFETDAARLNHAAKEGWPVTAQWTGDDSKKSTAELKILYIADRIEPESRVLPFFLQLPNERVREAVQADGHRFIDWKFRPGQRVKLLLPIEQWTDRIVLPVEAVIDEGAETFVMEQNRDHFDRLPVHVEYRDQRSVVISPDGLLRPGDTVVTTGAYQIHLAIKNKAGGGVDPHAGHSH